MPGRGVAHSARELELIDVIVAKKSDRVTIENATKHARFIVTLQRKMQLQKSRNVQWLKTRFKAISEFIPQHYTGGSLSTNFNHLSVVCYWFGLEAESKKYQDLQRKHEEQRKAEYSRQEPTEAQRDNWISLERLRHRLESHWLPKFKALEDGTHPVDAAGKRTIQHTLAAHLNIIEPPMRSVYAAVKITPRLPKATDIGHGKQNLLYLPARGQAKVYVNSDKISNKESRPGNLGPANWQLSPDTTDLLRRSLKLWPRNYVIFDKTTKPEAYNEIVRTALSFGGRVVGTRLIRSIYISDFYEKNSSPRMLDKIALGNKMRHSVETQELVYRKLSMEGQLIEENSDDDEPAQECPGVLVPSQNTSAKRQRRYYDAHKEEIRERARERWQTSGLHYRQQKTIAMLSAGVLRCRQATLDKLGIACQNGVWIATRSLLPSAG